MENKNYIEISGKDNDGPWEVSRIDEGKLGEKRTAQRFGELCIYVIKMIKGRDINYGIEYMGPNGFIFEKTEEGVLFHIVETHNRAIEAKKKLEELV